LDGFHIFQAVYESVASKIRRRPVALDKGAVRAFTGLVTVCVLLLGVGALLLDILRPAVMP
jgi:membrane-associated protease RseP (regulator of RpoE activity)